MYEKALDRYEDVSLDLVQINFDEKIANVEASKLKLASLQRKFMDEFSKAEQNCVTALRDMATEHQDENQKFISDQMTARLMQALSPDYT